MFFLAVMYRWLYCNIWCSAETPDHLTPVSNRPSVADQVDIATVSSFPWIWGIHGSHGICRVISIYISTDTVLAKVIPCGPVEIADHIRELLNGFPVLVKIWWICLRSDKDAVRMLRSFRLISAECIVITYNINLCGSFFGELGKHRALHKLCHHIAHAAHHGVDFAGLFAGFRLILCTGSHLCKHIHTGK